MTLLWQRNGGTRRQRCARLGSTKCRSAVCTPGAGWRPLALLSAYMSQSSDLFWLPARFLSHNQPGEANWVQLSGIHQTNETLRFDPGPSPLWAQPSPSSIVWPVSKKILLKLPPPVICDKQHRRKEGTKMSNRKTCAFSRNFQLLVLIFKIAPNSEFLRERRHSLMIVI